MGTSGRNELQIWVKWARECWEKWPGCARGMPKSMLGMGCSVGRSRLERPGRSGLECAESKGLQSAGRNWLECARRNELESAGRSVLAFSGRDEKENWVP